MNPDRKTEVDFLAGLIFGCLLATCISAIITIYGILPAKNSELNKFKAEAAQRGYGGFIVKEDGTPEWQWKDKSQ